MFTRQHILIALAACALAGCGAKMTQVHAQALMKGKIQVGMTRAQVEQQVGFPQKFERTAGMEILFYDPGYYAFVPGSAATYSPVVVKDGRVIGMGKAYYSNVGAVASAP